MFNDQFLSIGFVVVNTAFCIIYGGYYFIWYPFMYWFFLASGLQGARLLIRQRIKTFAVVLTVLLIIALIYVGVYAFLMADCAIIFAFDVGFVCPTAIIVVGILAILVNFAVIIAGVRK
jgi:hypothetical protein